MNLADVFTFLFVILGFVIVYVSYWLMAMGLFPNFVERAAAQFGKMPVRLPLLGAVTLVPLVVAMLGLSKAAPNALGKGGALAVMLAALLAALFGAAGLARRIGEGLKSARDESEPWRRMLRGSIVLGLSFVLPFIGTFLLMPYAFLGGFGAFLLCGWRRDSAVARVAPPLPAVAVRSEEAATASGQ